MELTEFKRRREELIDRMAPESVAIIPTSPEKIRNKDVFYPFRPDSDFFYLTGFNEPHCLAVISPERPQGEFIIFCRERDKDAEIWHGKRLGLDGARECLGANHVFPIEDLEDILPGLIENKKQIYFPMGRYQEFDNMLMKFVRQIDSQNRSGIHAPDQFLALSTILDEMRLFKNDVELKSIKKAIDITREAHIAAMKKAYGGVFEFELEAEIIGVFMRNGARSPAYPSIVGGGENACILHYTDNKDSVADGELVLIDAGAEYGCYAADITRTFPVNGSFTAEQKALYEIVLLAQQAAIEKVKPNNNWDEPHSAALMVIARGLKDLGILSGSIEEIIETEIYKKFFMHKTGHWLGLDVHDVGDYKIDNQWRVFEPGMITTIEPGIYISKSEPNINPRWSGIGIRIEDDILVTKEGNTNLSKKVPKTISQIEEIMG